MKVTVNNIEVNVFQGAKVKEIVRIYYTKQNQKQPKELPLVRDSYGHKVGFEGSVLPNSALYIKDKNRVSWIKRCWDKILRNS